MGLRSFSADCKGNIALSFGLLFMPILLATGAAIDVANANYTRTTLQAAADNAALAAGGNKGITDSELEKIIESYAMANGAQITVSSLKDVKGNYDRKAGTYTVTIEGKMKTSIMALAGVNELDVGVVSEVSLGSRALDLAMVLDVTGSMERSVPSGGTRMQALRASANNLINIIEKEKASYAILQVGVVPFAEYVNVGMGTDINTSGVKTTWSGCVGSRDKPGDTDATMNGAFPVASDINCPSANLLPLTSELADVRSKIFSLSGQGNTYMPAGVFWGTNLLTDEKPFSEGMDKDEMETYRGSKYMIVMTDGENTISPSYPLHDATDRPNANALTELACTNAKEQGIQVFTISFMVTAAGAQDMLNRCASLPTMAFDADNTAQLEAAFTHIGQKLAAISLTR
jgi:Flp pilus assembly protein TadG